MTLSSLAVLGLFAAGAIFFILGNRRDSVVLFTTSFITDLFTISAFSKKDLDVLTVLLNSSLVV